MILGVLAFWTLVGATLPEGKELDMDKLSALTTALGDVKIVVIVKFGCGATMIF